MSYTREIILTFFVMYLSPLTFQVYLLVIFFSKLYFTFIFQWIAFILHIRHFYFKEGKK